VSTVTTSAKRSTGHGVVLDARSAERFRGAANPIDARPGHIPGAVSAPWTENLDPATGRFRSTDELRRRFGDLGVAPGAAPAICQCGSGVTACHNLLALEVAGLPGAALYPGSWSDWSADPARPRRWRPGDATRGARAV
jgi:thiosulfate/3-mercaptopyruvate sulfurtransferase